MTAISFVIALAAAYVHLQTRGWYVADGLTIYVVAFALVLAVAVVAAVISRRPRNWVAAGVLVANLAATHWGWANGDVLTNQLLIDSATAIFFALWGRERWEWGIAAIYLLSVLTALLAYLNVIPGIGERPPVFLAWNYADATSACGYAASILLGLGSGDGGLRIMDRLTRRGTLANHARSGLWRGVAGLASSPFRRKEAG